MNAYFKGQPVFGPRGPAGPDGIPIGTVISYLGLTAPQDYLPCDGREYPICDYPDLAGFFTEQFGTVNYFGGDGETTFAVPDMRNLFLRGYHGEAEEALSGEIGQRQEATRIANTFSGTNSSGKAVFFWTSLNGANVIAKNSGFDTEEYLPNSYLSAILDIGGVSGHYPNLITTRPVNMAVLYCIKAVESIPAENVYSTEETRIGTWIDGKPLYRKCYSFTIPNTSGYFDVIALDDSVRIVDIRGSNIDNSGGILPFPYAFPSGASFVPYQYFRFIRIYVNHTEVYGGTCQMIIEYTKTTD